MKKQKHILIVDDDIEIQQLLMHLLRRHAMDATAVANSQAMYESLATQVIDLILLDVMMEQDNGLSLCKSLRAKSKIPIIMISAMGKPEDRVLGLELGADDYITKPFYPQEIIARIEAVLRRQQQAFSGSKLIEFSGWVLYPDQRRLFSPHKIEVSLSSGEYALLWIFLQHANAVLTREQLLNLLHEQNQSEVFDRSIDVQISRLRKRIESNPHNPSLIKTIRGIGYQFDSAVNYES